MSNARTGLIALAAGLSLAACQTEPTPVQRNAAIGAGIGALAGAAIAENDTQGAVIGGLLGGAIGAYTGCREQGGCYVGGNQVARREDLRYDSRAGRYYYVDPATGRTYWQDGDYRG